MRQTQMSWRTVNARCRAQPVSGTNVNGLLITSKHVFLVIGRFVISVALFAVLLPLVDILYASCIWPGESFGPSLIFKLAYFRFDIMCRNPLMFAELLFAALLSISIRTYLFSRCSGNAWLYLFLHILIVGLNPVTLYSLLMFVFPSLSAPIPHDADFQWLLRSFLLLQSRVLTAILIESVVVTTLLRFASRRDLVVKRQTSHNQAMHASRRSAANFNHSFLAATA